MSDLPTFEREILRRIAVWGHLPAAKVNAAAAEVLAKAGFIARFSKHGVSLNPGTVHDRDDVWKATDAGRAEVDVK